MLGGGADFCPGVARRVDRIDVIDQREVLGHKEVLGGAVGVERACGLRDSRCGRGDDDLAAALREAHDFRKATDGGYKRRERGGDAGVGVRREARLAGEAVVSEVDVEGVGDRGSGAGNFNDDAAGRDRGDREALYREPGGYGGNVGLRWAEELADLLGREPLMVERRAGVLLVGEELGEGSLDSGVSLEEDEEMQGRGEVD